MLLAVTESLNTAAWSDGLVVVRYAIFGGALLAFALALTRWDGMFPAVYGFLASLFWVATCFNWFIFQELSPQAGTQELLHRNWEWLRALFTGKASADNLIFVTQLALLGWWIGYLALWSLIRHQRLLHAVLPAGLALIVNAYFAPQNMTGFVILYLVAVLLLAIRIELARNETRWQLTRVRYAPDIALDFLRAGVMFSAVVILLAWAVPDAANRLTMERAAPPPRRAVADRRGQLAAHVQVAEPRPPGGRDVHLRQDRAARRAGVADRPADLRGRDARAHLLARRHLRHLHRPGLDQHRSRGRRDRPGPAGGRAGLRGHARHHRDHPLAGDRPGGDLQPACSRPGERADERGRDPAAG